jgi:tRNA modification GTPase
MIFDKRRVSDETIIAKSSASGGAIRGIIRMTGSESVAMLRELFEQDWKGDFEIDFCTGFDAALTTGIFTGHLFPWGKKQQKVPAKLFYWADGYGYTGQQTVEIHTIGSPPILDAVISAITASGTVRLARPGEFTLRAFLSGRLDLTQAEAVLGVINAASPKSLETALRQLAGGTASPLKQIRNILFETLVHLEAGFDFPEEDIEFISLQQVRQNLTEALEQTEILLRRMDDRGLSNEKQKIVLLGLPNAGKSALFNTLLRSNQAIVSPLPGTTRDYLEAETEIDGILCTLIDTAGTDRTTATPLKNEIEESARLFSKQIAEQADVILYCFEQHPNLDIFCGFDNVKETKILFVKTKSDLHEQGHLPYRFSFCRVSSKTGQGIETLRKEISQRLKNRNPVEETVSNTALRCRGAVRLAVDSLRRTLELQDELLLVSELRLALNALGQVDGSVPTEDILDAVFSQFCIGK